MTSETSSFVVPFLEHREEFQINIVQKELHYLSKDDANNKDIPYVYLNLIGLPSGRLCQ